MNPNLYVGIYPVVTIRGISHVQRFICTGVGVVQREGCLILRFQVLGESELSFWGNRSHGSDLPPLDYFRRNEAKDLARHHNLGLGVVEEFKHVIEFFDKPVNLEGLLPEKKVV